MLSTHTLRAESRKRWADISSSSAGGSEGRASAKHSKLGHLIEEGSYSSAGDAVGVDLADKIERLNFPVPLAMRLSRNHEAIFTYSWWEHMNIALIVRLEDVRRSRQIEPEEWKQRLIVQSIHGAGSEIDFGHLSTVKEEQFPVGVMLRRPTHVTRKEGVDSFKSKPEYYENVHRVSKSKRPLTPDYRRSLKEVSKRTWERQTGEWRSAWRKIDCTLKLKAELNKLESEIERVWDNLKKMHDEHAKQAKFENTEYKAMSHDEHVNKTRRALQLGVIPMVVVREKKTSRGSRAGRR